MNLLNHPVPDEHLKHIGDITVSFALLESIIQMVVGSFIAEHQRVGQIITAELAFKNLRALLISLYLERHGEDTDYTHLKDFMKRIADIEARRNQITHSIWGAGSEAGSITRIKTTAKERHGIRFQFEDIKANDLENIATEIKQLATELQIFWLHLLESGKVINNPSEKLW